MADTILQYYKKQNLYDSHSLVYLQNGIFKVLLVLYENSDIEHLDQKEYREVARTLEFCSTQNDGIKLLFQYKKTVFQILS